MTWFKTEAGVLVQLEHVQAIYPRRGERPPVIDYNHSDIDGGLIEIADADFARLEAMVMPSKKTSGTIGGLSNFDLAGLNESLKSQRKLHVQPPDNSMQASIASMIEDPGRGRPR